MENQKVTTSSELNEFMRKLVAERRLLGRSEEEEERILEKKRTRLYFAYGSNISISQMKVRCPQAKPMFKATLYNARMEFKTFANVVYEKKRRSFVKGVVYEVTQECIRSLDIYEGAPRFYKKAKCVVEGPLHKYYDAFIYVMQPYVRDYELPSQEYLNIICQGYDEWKMSTMPISRAWEYTAVKLGEIENFNMRLTRR